LDSNSYYAPINKIRDNKRDSIFSSEFFARSNIFGRNEVRYNNTKGNFTYFYVRIIFYKDYLLNVEYSSDTTQYCNLWIFGIEVRELTNSITIEKGISKEKKEL